MILIKIDIFIYKVCNNLFMKIRRPSACNLDTNALVNVVEYSRKIAKQRSKER